MFFDKMGIRCRVHHFMKVQIIEKRDKKAFAVIPYADFLRMQKELEDYHDLQELHKVKADPENQQGRPFDVVATELGLTKRRGKMGGS